MKFVVLLSGALGFALVTLTGWLSGRQADLVLRDAALACLAAAWVGRWFWQQLTRAFTQTLAERRAADLAREAAAQAAPVPSPAVNSAPPLRTPVTPAARAR